MVGIKGCLHRRHGLNHGSRLGIVQEVWLLLTYAVLGTHAAIDLAHIIHHEGLNHGLSALLEAFVFVAGQHNIKVEVAIADVTMAIRENQLFFGGAELW